jgi:hypothetical protein
VDKPVIPDEVMRDLAWSTVEHLHTKNAALLASPTLVSACRVGMDNEHIARAIELPHALPVEVLVGYRPGPVYEPRVDQPGLACDPRVWGALEEVGAFTRLRAMSVSRNWIRPDRVIHIARTPLGKQLRHLDVSLGITPIDDAEAWRDAFDASALHRLTLRCKLDIVRRPHRPGDVVGPWNMPDLTSTPNMCIALERMSGPHRLVLQLDRPINSDLVAPLTQLITPIGRRIDRIEVQDLVLPERVAQRQHGLLRVLDRMFERVIPTVGPLLSP